MDEEILEKQLKKKFAQRDKKFSPRMKVSGKNVFKLKKLIEQKHDRLSQRKSAKKSR